ncbi:MAG: site-specific DNA-methyltransferase, partial [Corynebacterium casei]
VNKLLSPKVLANAVRYQAQGDAPISTFNGDENLLIKGNNLIALSGLKLRFGGQIKLIYIDPPYNTGDDSFSYNDRFSRSTWLTFMKNRIDEAKKLLAKDGVIAIQISFHEGAYLQVMLDSLEGIHHVLSMHVLVRHPDRTLTSDKKFNDVMEMVLIYSRNPDFKMPKRVTDKTSDDYIYEIRTTGDGEEQNLGGTNVLVYRPGEWEMVKVAPNAKALKSHSIRGSLREKNSSGRFYVANIEPVAKTYEPLTLFKVPGIGDDGLGFRWFHTPKEGNKNGTYFQGMPQSSKTTEKPYANFQDFVQIYNRVNSEGGVEFRNGKKPEGLLEFLIDIFTAPGERVLDYHFGSGTTGAVAHKMNRKWIGIEQLDYIESTTIERLKNVIGGDSTGISSKCGWTGGGSFIYCELAEHNESLVSDVLEASESEQLLAVVGKLVQRGELRPEVLSDSLVKHRDEFLSLDLDDQKRVVGELINKNRLYVAYADREDETYGVSKHDKAFSESFYGERG